MCSGLQNSRFRMVILKDTGSGRLFIPPFLFTSDKLQCRLFASSLELCRNITISISLGCSEMPW